MSEQQFDWYRVSLINQQKPDLQQFQKIIRSSNISQTLDRVPTSYRKKLLTLFQLTSGKMKQEIKTMKNVNESLLYKKSALFDRIQQMEKGLQQSKNQLVRMKTAVVEKKKMSNKLKQKIETLKKNKSQQAYFCPLCSRNDFASRQIFTFHMFSQHQTYKTQENDKNKLSIPNNSFSSSVNNELKDFILTLKDKEMQLMKMILSQKKQMETQDLQRIYQRQINFMTMKNNSEPQYLTQKKYAMSQGLGQEFYENKQTNLGNDDGQIRGESQFLFYQKSQKYQKAAQKEEYSLRRALQERKKQLGRHPYYDVFKDLEENKSLNVDQQRLYEQESDRKRVVFAKNQQIVDQDTSKKETGFKFISNFNLKSNEEIQQSERKPPVQPLRMTSNNLQSQQFHPSITDRLKEEQKKAAANNSIYSDFGREKSVTKGISSQEGYVFNSGPLVDDNGGYSDWQDYFGEENVKKGSKLNQREKSQIKRVSVINNQDSNNDLTINFNISKDTNFNLPPNHPLNLPTQNSRQQDSLIQDEQIKLNPGSYSFVSRSSYSKQHISQLLSPSKQSIPHNNSQLNSDSQHQNKYSMYHNSFNQKSQIYDLSDSFSKRDLQLSKDESSINLSDLRLSKLEKKRAEEKVNQKNNPPITQKINSPTYGKKSQFSSQQEQQTQTFTKKPLDFILVSQEKAFNFQSSNQPKINLLNEFQRKVVQPQPPTPLVPSNYSFQKKQTYQFNEFYRQSPHQMIPKKSISPSNPNKNGILNNNEFFRKQNFSPNANTNEQSKNQQKALSPQQFFAQQMKKTSSYGTFNPKPSQNSNQDLMVSQSLQSQKSNLPPKVGLKEYQKSSFGQSQRQSSFNRSQQSLQRESNQRGSSSREKKRLRRHEDLQSGKEGLLNEFFKKQFSQSSNQNQIYQSGMQDISQGNRNSRTQSSGRSLEKSRKSLQKKSSVSQSQSQSYSRQNQQSYDSRTQSYEDDSGAGILDQFIK